MISYVEATVGPLKNDGQIKLYSAEDFAGMRRAGLLVAECLDAIEDIIRPGIATDEIDRFVYDFALAHGALPATLGYKGYMKSTCVSINHVVCHGIPSEKPLKDGDIANIDVTLILDGWHGDSSRMYAVGNVKRAAQRLMEVTHESMMRGIAAIKPGATTGDIGYAIQDYAEGERCSVVRDFCGHGVGRLFHDAPNILHYGSPRRRRRTEARHDLHHRADDQSRPAACEGARRRLDGGHPRPFALRPVRAFRRRDRTGLRDLHRLAEARARLSRRVHERAVCPGRGQAPLLRPS